MKAPGPNHGTAREFSVVIIFQVVVSTVYLMILFEERTVLFLFIFLALSLVPQ